MIFVGKHNLHMLTAAASDVSHVKCVGTTAHLSPQFHHGCPQCNFILQHHSSQQVHQHWLHVLPQRGAGNLHHSSRVTLSPAMSSPGAQHMKSCGVRKGKQVQGGRCNANHRRGTNLQHSLQLVSRDGQRFQAAYSLNNRLLSLAIQNSFHHLEGTIRDNARESSVNTLVSIGICIWFNSGVF